MAVLNVLLFEVGGRGVSVRGTLQKQLRVHIQCRNGDHPESIPVLEWMSKGDWWYSMQSKFAKGCESVFKKCKFVTKNPCCLDYGGEGCEAFCHALEVDINHPDTIEMWEGIKDSVRAEVRKLSGRFHESVKRVLRSKHLSALAAFETVILPH